MWMGLTKLTGKNTDAETNRQHAVPPVSFYSLHSTLNNGKYFSFEQLKGKKVLLVNTASDCGYTGQYSQLQQLQDKAGEKLVILAFPANDFKQQEQGSDAQIAAFCHRNYGISFPLMQKTVVVKGAEQNPVFTWLTDKTLNGWNNRPPGWNFSKYLVNENGILTGYFGPSVSPLSKQLLQAVE